MNDVNKIISFCLLFLVVSIYTANFVFAQSTGEFPTAVKSALQSYLGLPERWLKFPDFTYNFLLPFLAMFFIFIGLMRAVHIFENQSGIQVAIGIIIVFLFLSPSAWITGGPTFFEIIVVNTLLAAGVFGYFGFLILFFAGIALLVWGRVGGEYHKTRSYIGMHGYYRREIEDLEDERKQLIVRLRAAIKRHAKEAAAGNVTSADSLKDTIDKIRERVEDIDERIETVKTSRRHV